jgi:hypothetical protein
MTIVFDTGALLRPHFVAADFAATKWDSAETKADFANKLCKFIAADFKESFFTKALYNRLHQTFGNIAHYAELAIMRGPTQITSRRSDQCLDYAERKTRMFPKDAPHNADSSRMQRGRSGDDVNTGFVCQMVPPRFSGKVGFHLTSLARRRTARRHRGTTSRLLNRNQIPIRLVRPVKPWLFV